MTSYENLTVNQKVRAALHRDVRSICTETCHLMGLDITRGAQGITTELVMSKLALYALDLEAFAKHAKRTTINSDDVKLLARRNPSLKARLNKICSDNPSKDKRRKTVSARTDMPKIQQLMSNIVPSKRTTSGVDVNEPSTSKEPDPVEYEPKDDTIDLTLSQ